MIRQKNSLLGIVSLTKVLTVCAISVAIWGCGDKSDGEEASKVTSKPAEATGTPNQDGKKAGGMIAPSVKDDTP